MFFGREFLKIGEDMSMWGGDYFTTSARRMGLSGPRNGRTYIMYHGTSWWAAQKIMAKGFFQSKCGMLGQGVYLSRDLEKASRYPLDLTEHQKVVIKVKVNVGKVKKVDRQGHPLQKTWHDEGYDSAWVPPNCGMVKSGLEENCVWDPNRITVLDTIKSKTEPTLQSEDTDEEEDEEDTEERHHIDMSLDTFLSIQVWHVGGMLVDTPCTLLNTRRLSELSEKKVDRQGHPLQKTWHDEGYDSAWVPPNCGMVKSGLEETCVWDPNRITVLDTIK
nr:uncharacterized protein LOC115104390 [Oncorhynchus nerka]